MTFDIIPFSSLFLLLACISVPVRLGEPLFDAYSKWRRWGDEKVCCDYSLHMAITYWNEDVRNDMRTIASEQCGINSFKMFMAYKVYSRLIKVSRLESGSTF